MKKVQLKTSEYYDFPSDSWKPIADLCVERSQAGACLYDHDTIFVIGGYNKRNGALKSIEEYSISKNTFRILDINLPEGLRRFSMRKHETGILILGGVKQYFENSNSVYKVDPVEKSVQEVGILEKGGVAETEVFLDVENTFHLFFEELNGISPPYHAKFNLDDKIIEFT
jgi:hypothetical protein